MQLSEFINKGILSTNMTTRVRAFESVNARFVVVVMLVLSALIAVDRIYTPEVPINVDPASYAVAAHELLDGKNLYTDIWDHKPPAPFVTYALAEIAFGYSPQTLRILNFIVCLIVLWGIFLAAKHGPGGRIAGLVAASLWAIVSGSVGLEGRDPNTEPFIDAFVVFAFYLIVANRKDGLSFLLSFVVGLLFFCASLYKPVAAANAALITLAYFAFAENRKRAIYNSLTIGAVGVSGWLALFAYFYATGRGDIFYKSIVVFNNHYSGNIFENIVAPVFGQAEIFVDVIGPLAVFAGLGTVCLYLYDKRLGVLIAAYLISSWIALAAAGRFSVHYYQLWVPSLVIASAWGIGYFLVSAKTAHRAIACTAGWMLAATLILFQLPLYRNIYAKEFVPQLPVLNAANKTVDAIHLLLRDEETFYLWGNTPNLYLLANRRPPAGILFDNHLTDNPIADDLAAQVRAQLERSRPEILVIEQNRPPAPEWLTKEFESTPVYSDPQNYNMYARLGGRIANEKNTNGDGRQ
ncbi:MAG: ArnT family glycosyltransferase [Pyrinomonadaceae bacterium]